MSFHFRNAPFAADLIPLTQRISRETFSGDAPAALYHYTKPETKQKIIEGREIWATPVAEQEDLTEVTNGIALVERVSMGLIDHELNLFVRKVLAGVPEFMRQRREFIFITCFCGTEMSRFHLQGYGPSCLKFDVPAQWVPLLECGNPQADSWYSPVIYDEIEQCSSIAKFLAEVSLLLMKHTSGAPEEDSRGWIAAGAIRDIAQCLLTIVSCFKRKKYEADEEWRLIVMPRLTLSHTAPKMIDQEFSTCILDEPRRHICLLRKEKLSFSEGVVWPSHQLAKAFPFDEIIS